jgi:transposase-like protein
MSSGIPHSDETRAAVLAALLAGQSVHKVADQFQVGRATVQRWRDQAGLGVGRAEPQKQAEIGELVLNHIRSALLALNAQAVLAADPAWLAAQPASELAVLYGVMADKAHRLLAALEPAPEHDDA